MDGSKPTLVDGAQAKVWLRHRWHCRKQATAHDEAHCFRCRKSRTFATGSATFKPVNTKVLSVTGKCAVCGCQMNKFTSANSVALFNIPDDRKRADSAA
ncbi:MAG: hypothetical protein Rhims3KO_09380 [Hyphomicrobiales bacterium]